MQNYGLILLDLYLNVLWANKTIKVVETKYYNTKRYDIAYDSKLIDFYPAVFRYDDFHKVVFNKKGGYQLKLFVTSGYKRLKLIIIDLEKFEECLYFYTKMINYLYLRFYTQIYEE